jgi:hypothetical protein
MPQGQPLSRAPTAGRPSDVLAAVNSLLDRGIGKPTQTIAVEPTSPMLEAPRNGDDAKDVTPERPVIIEQSRMPKPIR